MIPPIHYCHFTVTTSTTRRGLGAPHLPSAGSSHLFQSGYWPSTYARTVLEAIFVSTGVKRLSKLTAVFDMALLPSTQAFGYSDHTRTAYELLAGYRPTDQSRYMLSWLT